MDQQAVPRVGGPQGLEPDRVARALAEILEGSRRVPPDRLPELGESVSRESGVTAVRIWLADYGVRWLGCFPPEDGRGKLAIDGTLAGRAFEVGESVEVAASDGVTLWVPLVDGVDRIGVVEFELDRLDAERRGTLSQIASLLAAEIVTRGQYTDSMAVARRTESMTLAAEMQWALLRPPTFSTDEVSVAASVDPSYRIAGDAYDYAYTSGTLDFALFDAMGHDLRASPIAALAVGTYRWGRRGGLGLEEQAALMDATVAGQFQPTMFVTALLCRFTCARGCSPGRAPDIHRPRSCVKARSSGRSSRRRDRCSAAARSCRPRVFPTRRSCAG